MAYLVFKSMVMSYLSRFRNTERIFLRFANYIFNTECFLFGAS